MVFSSIQFLFLFLPAFLAVLALAPAWAGNAVLLGFSLLFYAVGEGVFVVLLAGSALLTWALGRRIAATGSVAGDVAGGTTGGPARRRWLALGIGLNLAPLLLFKYAGFLGAEVLGLEGTLAALPLPLGLSFFTFQGISYLVDVHRGQVAPEPSPWRFATYLTMFPQLVAGPIVRYAAVAGALRGRRVALADLREGFGILVLGLGAKVLIADTVAPLADRVFAADPGALRLDAAALGIAAFSVQIYFDFLGYSLMAVGLGRALGFRLPRNFDLPYAAQSVTGFWRRWHIALSTWFRDYLYIPLGGNRRGAARTLLNLWIVFLATGLWHGAAWTFLAWGAGHGAALTLERLGLGRLLARLPGVVGQAWTLGVVALLWVPFRASDLGHAGGVLAALGQTEADVTAAAVLTNETLLALAAGVLLSGPTPARLLGRVAALPSHGEAKVPAGRAKAAAGLSLSLLIASASILVLLAGGHAPFLYFRF